MEQNALVIEGLDQAPKKRYRNRYYPNRVLTEEIPLKNGDRDTILKWINDIHIVEWYTTYLLQQYIDEPYVEDKIQDLWVALCKKTQAEWDKIYVQGFYSVSAYVAGLIHRQVRSGTSLMYKKYQRYDNMFVNKDDEFWLNYERTH